MNGYWGSRALFQLPQCSDMVWMGVCQENKLYLERVLLDSLQDVTAAGAGVDYHCLFAGFISHDVAVAGHASHFQLFNHHCS